MSKKVFLVNCTVEVPLAIFVEAKDPYDAKVKVLSEYNHGKYNYQIRNEAVANGMLILNDKTIIEEWGKDDRKRD